MDILNDGFEMVDPRRLKPHPMNPNRGDVEAIRESMKTNGFFGAIVANRRTMHVLAGNHRMMVAAELGLEAIPVTWVDVDDATERRILVADNRLARLGEDDPASLAELLAMIQGGEDGLSGTGYTDDDLDRIVESVAHPDAQDWADAADAVPDGERGEFRKVTFTVHADHLEVVEHALEVAKDDDGDVDLREDADKNKNSNGAALYVMAKRYLDGG